MLPSPALIFLVSVSYASSPAANVGFAEVKFAAVSLLNCIRVANCISYESVLVDELVALPVSNPVFALYSGRASTVAPPPSKIKVIVSLSS